MDFCSDLDSSTSPHFLSYGKKKALTALNQPDFDMEEDGVRWQNSQTSSALESLLGSKKKKGVHINERRTSLDDTGSTWSPMGSGFASSPSTASSSTFNFFDESASTAASSFASNASKTRCSSTPSLSRRPRSNALVSSSHKNVSTNASSSSSSKNSDITETFTLLVKQVTSRVDENLAAHQNGDKSHPRTGLSRTSSRGAIFGNVSSSTTGTSRKPVSASGVLAPGRRPGQNGRVLERAMSANAVVGRDREHRVGGDMKGKGKLRDGAVGEDGLLVGEQNPNGSRMHRPVEIKNEELDGTVAGVAAISVVEVAGDAGRRDTCAMPPPGLPPERIRNGVSMNFTSIQQVPIKPFPGSTSKHLPALAPAEQVPTALKLSPAQVQEPAIMIKLALSRPPVHANVTSTLNKTSPNIDITPGPSQYSRYQAPAPPKASQTSGTRTGGGGPPLLGMRRAHTFSSGASQTAYAPFGFASQNPNSRYGGGNGNGGGVSGGANANGSGITNGGASEIGIEGLPVRQRGFKPPLKAPARVGGVAGTLELIKASPPTEPPSSSNPSVSSPSSASGSHNPALPRVQVAPNHGGPGFRQAPFKPPLLVPAVGPTMNGGVGPSNPLPLNSSLSSSTTSSSTTGSSSSDRGPAFKFNSALALATSVSSGSGSVVEEKDEFDMILEDEPDDPNDSSYGDIDMAFDLDALEDACRKYD